jgi:hypothetical protein|tara:strand:+ start:1198 stop:1776 length:579 start_codon:yes stop_codon:yes gene_type:complete
MKKSELKKYIRENIISELSESTEDEIAKTKELTQAVQDLESAKKQAGIEEKTANSSDDVIDPADYGVIGQNYLAGFGRENTLDLDSLEKLGRKIVKQLYKGDFKAAKAKFIKEEIPVTEDEEEVFNPDAKVKKTKGLAKAKEELALLTREMKSLAKKYSKAEGADKEKLVKILKDKTKLKKELESILDNKKI